MEPPGPFGPASNADGGPRSCLIPPRARMSRHPGPTSRSVAEIVVAWALVLGTCRGLRLQGLGQIFCCKSDLNRLWSGLDEVPAGLHENSTDQRHDPVSTEGEHDDRNRQE